MSRRINCCRTNNMMMTNRVAYSPSEVDGGLSDVPDLITSAVADGPSLV
jgi:hypothetical protein